MVVSIVVNSMIYTDFNPNICLEKLGKNNSESAKFIMANTNATIMKRTKKRKVM
jgi:hypothetical protein